MNKLPEWLEEFGPFEEVNDTFRTYNTELFPDMATKILLILPGSFYQAENSRLFENVSSNDDKGVLILVNRYSRKPYIEVDVAHIQNTYS